MYSVARVSAHYRCHTIQTKPNALLCSFKKQVARFRKQFDVVAVAGPRQPYCQQTVFDQHACHLLNYNTSDQLEIENCFIMVVAWYRPISGPSL